MFPFKWLLSFDNAPENDFWSYLVNWTYFWMTSLTFISGEIHPASRYIFNSFPSWLLKLKLFLDSFLSPLRVGDFLVVLDGFAISYSLWFYLQTRIMSNENLTLFKKCSIENRIELKISDNRQFMLAFSYWPRNCHHNIFFCKIYT